MNRAVTGLFLLMAVQAVVLLAQYWPDLQKQQSTRPQALLSTDSTEITAVNIDDGKGHKVELTHRGGHWLLPQRQNLPADAQRIESLLAAINAANRGWPVAHTAAARQRFKVADYLYQRRIELLANGQAAGVVYLGTSPGYRKVYARNGNDNAIYSITFNVFDAPVQIDAWLDRRLLQIRTPLRIDADTYSLHREGSQWRAGTGGIPDQRELLILLTTLQNLQVHGIADEKLSSILDATEADIVLTVQGLAATVTLSIYTHQRQHFIRSSEYPFYFKMDSADFDQLHGIDIARISALPGAA